MANAPHVNFFLPFLRRFGSPKQCFIVTLRDFNQTVELSKKYGIEGTVIGKHGGQGHLAKIMNLLNRSLQLAIFARGKDIDIAVSHNSYPHTVAGKLSGSRVVTLMDYEGQPANHIAFRIADKVIVPDLFPDQALKTLPKNIRIKRVLNKPWLRKSEKEALEVGVVFRCQPILS